jgi:Sec-independent protein secretion pathway component TatC
MCLLYEVGILGSRWFVRISKAPEEGEQEAS